MTNVQICRQCGVAATGAETEAKCRNCGTNYKERIMGSEVALTYNDGRLIEIIMYNPLAMCVEDLHHGFVSINGDDGNVSSKLFLEPDQAESLTKELIKLFPQAAESVGLQFTSPPFDPLAACQKIADYLEPRDSPPAERLAMRVVHLACCEQMEHDKLTEAGI